MKKGDMIKDKITGKTGYIDEVYPFQYRGRNITVHTARADAHQIKVSPELNSDPRLLRLAEECEKLIEGEACQVKLNEIGLAHRNFSDLEKIS